MVDVREVGVIRAFLATWSRGSGAGSAGAGSAGPGAKSAGVPDVSVIVPTYRRPDLLRQALDSVREQTWGGWECLVIDSGFADSARDVVTGMGDPRFRYVAHHPPGVAATARNHGVAESVGRVLAFLDQDDLWHPRRIERGLELMAGTGAEFVYAPLWIRHMAADGIGSRPMGWRAAWREGLLQPRLMVTGQDAGLHLEHVLVPASGVMMTRSLFDRAGGFPEATENFGTDDYELWLIASSLSAVAADDRPAGWLRRHEGQATWGIDLVPRRAAVADRIANRMEPIAARTVRA